MVGQLTPDAARSLSSSSGPPALRPRSRTFRWSVRASAPGTLGISAASNVSPSPIFDSLPSGPKFHVENHANASCAWIVPLLSLDEPLLKGGVAKEA